MSVQDVSRQLDEIREEAARGDNESAHQSEAYLRNAVLVAIANGTAEDPAGLAREALKSSEIKFDRLFA
jgi:hypothetical protein